VPNVPRECSLYIKNFFPIHFFVFIFLKHLKPPSCRTAEQPKHVYIMICGAYTCFHDVVCDQMCSLPFFLIRRSSPSHVETILLSFPKPLQSYTFALLHRSFSFAVYTMYRAQQRKTNSSIQTATVDTMSRVQQKKVCVLKNYTRKSKSKKRYYRSCNCIHSFRNSLH
jgi:hypothetical protein